MEEISLEGKGSDGLKVLFEEFITFITSSTDVGGKLFNKIGISAGNISAVLFWDIEDLMSLILLTKKSESRFEGISGSDELGGVKRSLFATLKSVEDLFELFSISFFE